MTPTPDELQRTRDNILDMGKIDPIDAPNAILVIADAFDIDPNVLMGDILTISLNPAENAMRYGKATQLAFNLLEISQSNLKRCISDLIDVIRIELELEEIDRG